MRLKAQLPKLVKVFAVNDAYFNHADFLWSLRVNELVNDPVREILQTMDRPEWRYSGPSPDETNEIGGSARKPTSWAVEKRPIGPVKSASFIPGLEFFAENVDQIIANTMPRFVYEKDVAVFKREWDLQKTLFGDAIELVKTAGAATYGRVRDDFADGASDRTDDGKTVAAKVASGVRSAAETRPKTTAALVNDKVAYASKSVADGVAKAESAMAGGVARAEQSVVESIAKAENFVHYGLNKADPAVGNALFKTVRKAFWFLK